MSMRVGNQADANIISSARTDATRSATPETATEHMPSSSLGADNVSLSSASGLASSAKGLTPADREAKIAALTAQVRSGQYRVDASQVSRSIIQSHFGIK